MLPLIRSRAAQRVKNVLPGSGRQRAQVTGSLRRRGNPHQDRARIFGARPLIISKVEGLVFDDRPADGPAKLAPKALRDQPAARVNRHRLRERISCLGEIVVAEHEGAAVEFVGARLGRGGYDSCLRLPEFCVEVGARYFCLNHRIEIRDDDHIAVHEVPVVGAVQQVAKASKMLAVHIDRNAPLRVFG